MLTVQHCNSSNDSPSSSHRRTNSNRIEEEVKESSDNNHKQEEDTTNSSCSCGDEEEDASSVSLQNVAVSLQKGALSVGTSSCTSNSCLPQVPQRNKTHERLLGSETPSYHRHSMQRSASDHMEKQQQQQQQQPERRRSFAGISMAGEIYHSFPCSSSVSSLRPQEELNFKKGEQQINNKREESVSRIKDKAQEHGDAHSLSEEESVVIDREGDQQKDEQEDSEKQMDEKDSLCSEEESVESMIMDYHDPDDDSSSSASTTSSNRNQDNEDDQDDDDDDDDNLDESSVELNDLPFSEVGTPVGQNAFHESLLSAMSSAMSSPSSTVGSSSIRKRFSNIETFQEEEEEEQDALLSLAMKSQLAKSRSFDGIKRDNSFDRLVKDAKNDGMLRRPSRLQDTFHDTYIGLPAFPRAGSFDCINDGESDHILRSESRSKSRMNASWKVVPTPTGYKNASWGNTSNSNSNSNTDTKNVPLPSMTRISDMFVREALLSAGLLDANGMTPTTTNPFFKDLSKKNTRAASGDVPVADDPSTRPNYKRQNSFDGLNDARKDGSLRKPSRIPIGGSFQSEISEIAASGDVPVADDPSRPNYKRQNSFDGLNDAKKDGSIRKPSHIPIGESFQSEICETRSQKHSSCSNSSTTSLDSSTAERLVQEALLSSGLLGAPNSFDALTSNTEEKSSDHNQFNRRSSFEGLNDAINDGMLRKPSRIPTTTEELTQHFSNEGTTNNDDSLKLPIVTPSSAPDKKSPSEHSNNKMVVSDRITEKIVATTNPQAQLEIVLHLLDANKKQNEMLQKQLDESNKMAKAQSRLIDTLQLQSNLVKENAAMCLKELDSTKERLAEALAELEKFNGGTSLNITTGSKILKSMKGDGSPSRPKCSRRNSFDRLSDDASNDGMPRKPSRSPESLSNFENELLQVDDSDCESSASEFSISLDQSKNVFGRRQKEDPAQDDKHNMAAVLQAETKGKSSCNDLLGDSGVPRVKQAEENPTAETITTNHLTIFKTFANSLKTGSDHAATSSKKSSPTKLLRHMSCQTTRKSDQFSRTKISRHNSFDGLAIDGVNDTMLRRPHRGPPSVQQGVQEKPSAQIARNQLELIVTDPEQQSARDSRSKLSRQNSFDGLANDGFNDTSLRRPIRSQTPGIGQVSVSVSGSRRLSMSEITVVDDESRITVLEESQRSIGSVSCDSLQITDLGPRRRNILQRKEDSHSSTLKKLAEQFYTGVTVCTHIYHFKKYEKTFIGREAVDFMVKSGMASTREEAVFKGQRLMKEVNLFHHVSWDHMFKDGYFHYRYNDDLTTAFTGITTKLRAKLDDVSSTTSSIKPSQVSYKDLRIMGRVFKRNILVSMHTYHLKRYKKSFVGKEAVDRMIESGMVTSRKAAVFLGQRLLEELELFHHISHKFQFKDTYLLYQYNEKYNDSDSISAEGSSGSLLNSSQSSQPILISPLGVRHRSNSYASFASEVSSNQSLSQSIRTTESSIPGRPVFTRSQSTPMLDADDSLEGDLRPLLNRQHSQPLNLRTVTWDKIHVRLYERTLDVHPSTSSGPSVGLGWRYVEIPPKRFDPMKKNSKKKTTRDFNLSGDVRKNMMLEWGFTRRQITQATRLNQKIRQRRKQTLNNLTAKTMEQGTSPSIDTVINSGGAVTKPVVQATGAVVGTGVAVMSSGARTVKNTGAAAGAAVLNTGASLLSKAKRRLSMG